MYYTEGFARLSISLFFDRVSSFCFRENTAHLGCVPWDKVDGIVYFTEIVHTIFLARSCDTLLYTKCNVTVIREQN